jgi:hypothetical protein
VINDQFVIGAELLPEVSYSTGKREIYYFNFPTTEVYDISSIDYGL